MNLKSKLIIGLVGFSIIGGGVAYTQDRPICNEVSIEVGSVTRCLTQTQYDLQKKALYDEYQKNKADHKPYDFDINQRDILSGVLNREISVGGLQIQNADNAKIRSEFLKLLSNNQ